MLLSPRLQSQHPLLELAVIFALWKAALILVTLTSPGPGYDTSTTLLEFAPVWPNANSHDVPLISKFIRWDTIYFVQMAQRGHVFEQEWAFGKGISGDLLWAAQGLFRTNKPTLWQIATAGVVMSHLAHFGSMILLWAITSHLHDRRTTKHSHIAFIAAILYILSPAGIFVSTPYAESIFAFRTFLGLYLLIAGLPLLTDKYELEQSVNKILAGMILGRATVTRSNGILAGLFYTVDALQLGSKVIQGGLNTSYLIEIASIVGGGLLVGWGLVSPQLQAYHQYCTQVPTEERRQWCQHVLPSIFAFAQSHYWNVGLFRYWTVSNLPLFALATPTLCLMIFSAVQCIPTLRKALLRQPEVPHLSHLNQAWLWRLALPQLVLAVLALTSYHVQIITRLSSGYPLWYIWLAARICDGKSNTTSKITIRWMVLYAFIQGGLYASFLPPA